MSTFQLRPLMNLFDTRLKSLDNSITCTFHLLLPLYRHYVYIYVCVCLYMNMDSHEISSQINSLRPSDA